MYGVIYKITNTINRKPYVGQTKRSIKVRFKEHLRRNSPLGNAMRKYGIEHFTIEILEECDSPEQLNEREHFWIAHFNCIVPDGYNLIGGSDRLDNVKRKNRLKCVLNLHVKQQQLVMKTQKLLCLLNLWGCL